MKKTVTVDHAILRGKQIANTPAVLMLAVLIMLTLYLGFSETLSIWAIIPGSLLSLGVTWLYWNIAIVRWKVWAFKNVQDTDELTKKATEEKLIWPTDSVLDQSEIILPKARKKLEANNYKFHRVEPFHDDPTVPKETIIYFSKGKNLLDMVLLLGASIGGLVVMKESEGLWGLVIVIGGIIMAFLKFLDATNRKPQIIINDKGIQTISAGFQEWNGISNEKVYTSSSRRIGTHRHTKSHDYLKFDYPGGFEDLHIDDLTISRDRLKLLLKIYRGRSEQRVHR